jgi:predicted DNA-binding transcriptional regulator YafY
MSNTATRLITLLMLLQRQPNQKANELANELGVSVRSVHRYIAMLDDMGIPIYSERGPYGGFSLVRGYKMPPLVFTPEEAVAVYLGTGLVEQMWGQLYRDAARGALAKLDNVLPEEQQQEITWARRALLATCLHRVDPNRLTPHLEKLRYAIHDGRRVRMTYRGQGQPEPLLRELDPYALVHRGGWWYSVGYCHLRQARRTFRVDRIIDLAVLDQTFQVPADFDAQVYLAAEPQPQVKVRLRFVPDGAGLAIDNRPYWDTLAEQPDGSVVVTFAAPDLNWAASIVLSYGGWAVALEPAELRQLVHERAAGIAGLHSPELNDNC